ncbi:alpha/beta hydrolase-fold protein [Pseudoduganella sp. LjRoot289]|uniref:alpha/beta hydrolase n=1 Tax=Pseudoduganella sp. LjRoot289 TaxID=3342314 RepID=UPI003ECD3078
MVQRGRIAALAGLGLAVLGIPSLAAAGEGSFVSLGDFPSRQVAPRKVVVWLPPGYDPKGERHAVLYMHDGQNLFDPGTATGRQPWDVHKRLAALLEAGALRPAIIVGIASGRERAREYGPAAAVEALAPALRASLLGDPPIPGGQPTLSEEYLRFIVDELKPAVDARFRTSPERADTFIMGSSMGGLISLYALARYPEVFAGAACLSTHWPLTTNFNLLTDKDDPRPVRYAAAYFDWLARKLPRAGRHKLYFDHGDATLDALYAPYQQQVDAIVRAKGYRAGVDWISQVFPGAAHSEPAWRERVEVPLRFLLSR